MKKSLIALCTLGLMAAFIVGCSTGGGAAKGPSDEELIGKLVGDWQIAATAKDLDKTMTFYSEKFQSFAPEYSDKAGLKGFLKDAISQGLMDGAVFNVATMKIVKGKDKDTYAAGPIDLKATFGSATIELTLKKEATGWIIAGMDVNQT